MFGKLVDRLRNYSEAKVEYYKLEAAEKFSKAYAGLLSFAITLAVIAITLVFVSIAAAIWIGRLTDDYLLGFALVALCYVVLCALVLIFNKNLVWLPILNQVIKQVFKGQENGIENQDNGS